MATVIEDSVVDLKRYGRLLAKASPRVITTEEEHARALGIVESLMEKGEHKMTPEEDTLLDLLTNLIRDYEGSVWPARAKLEAGGVIGFLLDQRGLTAKDLWPVLGSKGRVSEILSGKREVSRAQARKLAEFFRVGVELFV
jgi:HTH-type transcriptional regulator/antitoxin HigA